MTTQGSGTILVAPHQFPNLEREKVLAAEFGLELVAAADQASFREAMPEAAIVMVTPYAKVLPEEIARMRRCVAIVRYGIGYDNIDVVAARAAGVPVSIVPDASSEEVAAHAFAMGLALARRIPGGQAAIAEGRWAGSIGYDAPKLSDLEVGVVGLGRIGRFVANWWQAVGARVRAFDPFVTLAGVASATLDQVIEDVDLVSLHLPLTPDTRNLISRETLARMRSRAVIVNVSRGGLIDEHALADALHAGGIAGAGLDTFAQEPLAADSPLRAAPNLILTPHVAWRSSASLDALQQGAVDRVRAALEGRPLPDIVN
jgi:D-3-phosphoglycerate dehydrogenase